MKRYLSRILVLALIVSMVAMVPAFAESGKPQFKMFMLWENNDHVISTQLQNWPEGAEMVKVTSSNKAVVKPAMSSDTASGSFSLTALKAGKARITVKYKLNGKTQSVSAVYTVKKYPKPFKSLKVNGKSVSLAAHKYQYTMKSYKKSTMTVTFKLNSGWKVVNAFYQCHTDGDQIKIKSGKKFSVQKGKSAYINLLLMNKKEEKFFYHLNLNKQAA